MTHSPHPNQVRADESDSEAAIAWSSAADLAISYRNGSLTPTRVAEVLLDRIERLNPSLNAFAAVLPDLVLEQADRAGKELAAGIDRGPLHGVPIGVKDLMGVEGWPTSFGSTVAPVLAASEDAALVARLKEAGAVIIGKTALLEYAYGAVHPDVGPTRNPWNLERTAGGSSGGSAAALAAGLMPLALGTDTGGSIRIPAAYCGVVGLKPTFGRLPVDGIFPLSWSLDAVGPMARTLPDLRTFFEVLEPTSKDIRASIEGRRFGIPQDYITQTDVAPELAALFRNVTAALRAAGATVREMSFQSMAHANQVLVDILRPEATVIHDQNIRSIGSSKGAGAQYSGATFAQLRSGYAVPATVYIAARQQQDRLKQQFAELMKDFDALLMPSVGFVAPAEDPGVDDPAGAAEMHFSGPFNVLGVPALSMPLGLIGGMPVGLQLVTAHGEDLAAVELAIAVDACAEPRAQQARPAGY